MWRTDFPYGSLYALRVPADNLVLPGAGVVNVGFFCTGRDFIFWENHCWRTFEIVMSWKNASVFNKLQK
jgi:hypothetical protein